MQRRGLTQQQLGGAVPEGDHVVGVGAEGGPKLACKPKIAHLELSPVAVQDVAGLQVSVQHPVLVEVVHASKQLLHQALHLRTDRNTHVHTF